MVGLPGLKVSNSPAFLVMMFYHEILFSLINHFFATLEFSAFNSGTFSWNNFIIGRRSDLEKMLACSDVSEEEQINLLKDLERKETEYMRLKRHKISVDDFDLLAIIGRGAFGEVRRMKYI